MHRYTQVNSKVSFNVFNALCETQNQENEKCFCICKLNAVAELSDEDIGILERSPPDL